MRIISDSGCLGTDAELWNKGETKEWLPDSRSGEIAWELETHGRGQGEERIGAEVQSLTSTGSFRGLVICHY